MGKFLERCFERLLWHSRLLLLSGVVACLCLTVGALYMATIDTYYLLGKLYAYADPMLDSASRASVRATLVTYLIKAMDNYLISAILLLFALGLYELFISKVDATEARQLMPRRLQVRSLGDLKDRIAKLILLVLAIEYVQHALEQVYTSVLELLSLAVGVLLVSAAFYLSSLKGSHKEPADRDTP